MTGLPKPKRPDRRPRQLVLASLANARAARKANLAVSNPLTSLTQSHTPSVQLDAARSLMPRLLADEMAYLSSVADQVAEMRQALLTAVRNGFYNAKTQNLPSLVNSLVKSAEAEVRIVQSLKGLGQAGNESTAVLDLIQRAELLRGRLLSLGLIDKLTGQVIMPEPHQKPQEPRSQGDPSPGTGDGGIVEPGPSNAVTRPPERDAEPPDGGVS